MCQSSPSSHCGQCYQIGLTQNEKNMILNIHNWQRYQVSIGNETRGNPGPQPAAAKGAMKTLVRKLFLKKCQNRFFIEKTFFYFLYFYSHGTMN